MSGFSGNKERRASVRGGDVVLRLDDQVCPHCDRELEAEFFEFPPALQRKYGKTGEWYYHPCTPECEQKNDQKEWERTRRDARIEVLRQRSGVAKRLKSCTLYNFKQRTNRSTETAVSKVRDYVDQWEENLESGKGLYFCGDVGTGKTHLAVGVMNWLIEKHKVPSLFVTVPELLDNLRGAYSDPNRNLDEWMDAVKNANLLVLDDLGSEKVTSWVQERLFVIVNHRYQEALPTLFTSNIAPGDLAAQMGARTASRVMSMCTWIALEGKDYRQTSAGETF